MNNAHSYRAKQVRWARMPEVWAVLLKDRKEKMLLKDCLVLLTSIVLTDPTITRRQSKALRPLIKRLKKGIAA